MFWKDRSIDRQNFCDQILLFLDFFSSPHFASFCGGTKTYSALTERIFFVMSVLFRLFSVQTLNREATAMFCVILLVQGVWEIKILASGLSEKNVTQLTYFETTRSCYSNLKPRLYFFANAQLSSSKVRAKFNVHGYI